MSMTLKKKGGGRDSGGDSGQKAVIATTKSASTAAANPAAHQLIDGVVPGTMYQLSEIIMKQQERIRELEAELTHCKDWIRQGEDRRLLQSRRACVRVERGHD